MANHTQPTKFTKLLLKAFRIDSNTLTDVPLTVQAIAGQTAKLSQFLDADGNELSSFLVNGDGAVKYAEVTVPTAAVKLLFSAPYTLVAAPGAGRVLDFLGAMIVLDYSGVAYDGIAAGENVCIRYTDASGVIASTTLESDGFFDGTADQIRTMKPLTTDITPVANVPLVLAILTGEIATGTSPVRVKIWYRVISTGL